MKLLRNDAGEIYYVKIPMVRTEAATFLQEMWRSIDGDYYPQGADALCEWTDRGRCIRSTYSNYGGVCIRTHAWTPEADQDQLHESVLSFLRERGYDV
jgi:hypothetical protein